MRMRLQSAYFRVSDRSIAQTAFLMRVREFVHEFEANSTPGKVANGVSQKTGMPQLQMEDPSRRGGEQDESER